jgi:hypothetical protein
MLYVELKLFLLIFERRIRIGGESELTGNVDNRGECDEGVEGRVDERKQDGKECNAMKYNKMFLLTILP